jgi:hypothetical protein
MTDEPQTDVPSAEQALALARQASAPAALAARRWVRRVVLAEGAAYSLAILGMGLVIERFHTSWKPVVIFLLIAALGTAMVTVANRGPVRAVPAKGRSHVIGFAGTAILVGTMATGPEFIPAYPIGAALTFLVYAFGARWIAR